ncbi:MAG: glycosyl hydrolase, partial [Actinobacteria bacterium]|nr:glycosyl hydrolase [Actinomycetota bacterium]
GHGSPERSVEIELVAGRSVEITVDYPIDDHPGIRGFMVGLQEPQHTDLFAEAVELAAASDRALVVVGTDDDWETESEDRTTMQLPGRQDDLISAVAAVNPNTVVVVNAGSPVTMPWRDEVAAILYIWFPGGALGDALCDVVFGETDPGGRLPLTFPVSLSDTPAAPHYPGVDGVMRYGEGRQIGHRWYRATSTPPQFWFGHGLSYTSFEVGDVSVTGDLRDGVTVAMSITNVGSRVGVHVAQLFTSFDGDHPEMSDDVRFVGSIKVELAPHETRRVSIELDARRFSSWLSDRWEIPRGDHVIELGRSAGDVVEIGRLTI